MMNKKVCVIAEAGVNHNGSVERAKEMIRVAAEAGADVIKFQTGKAENVVSKFAVKAAYQNKTTGSGESQLDMIKKITMPFEAYSELLKCCRENRIEFMSAPFDLESVDFLADQCKVRALKIPSGEATNAPLLLTAARKQLPIILSTGMCTLAEVEQALGVLAFGYIGGERKESAGSFEQAYRSLEGQEKLLRNVTLLHCTTEYPALFETVNLKAMQTLKNCFGLRVGYSDHTQGISVSLAAVALGANIIEKHFTLDKSLPGPDHKASLNPKELKELIREIRNVEMSLGTGRKLVTSIEADNKSVMRKSLIAKTEIKKGQKFSEHNLTLKRPGDGISPYQYWEYLGKIAERDYAEDEKI